MEDGSWSGVIGSITRNEAIVGVSATSMTVHRLDIADFLTPLMHER